MEGWFTDVIDGNFFSSQHFPAFLYVTQWRALLDKMFRAKINKKGKGGRERRRLQSARRFEGIPLWGKTTKEGTRKPSINFPHHH